MGVIFLYIEMDDHAMPVKLVTETFLGNAFNNLVLIIRQCYTNKLYGLAKNKIKIIINQLLSFVFTN